jgi:hypothetical protein
MLATLQKKCRPTCVLPVQDIDLYGLSTGLENPSEKGKRLIVLQKARRLP